MFAFGTAGCGIKIQTGQTTEGAVDSSETKANEIRSHWARKLEHSTPKDFAYLLKMHIDSTANVLIKYGWKMAEKWHEGNTGRGEVIPDHEMRDLIESWIYSERPILKAWEDNIEYAWDLILESGLYPKRKTAAIKRLINQYYSVYSGVMYPSGTVEDYEDNLHSLRGEIESISRNLEL